MYSSIHSLAHRAPASRPRVRWQPYGSLPSSSASTSATCSRSPSSTCLNSPSSAPSSPISTPQCDAEPPKQTPTPQPQTLSRDAQPREKKQYALGLVDQAVKSLCEIWRPQDIPQVFLTTSRAIVPGTSSTDYIHASSIPTHNRNTQHPPPTTQTPPPSLFATGTISPSADGETLYTTQNLVPMKGFVHEVLRRSKTSGSVLQTALCYLEAIRPKIPELANQDKTGEGLVSEMESAERITPATEAELAQEVEFSDGMDTIIVHDSEESMDTIRLCDSYSGSTAISSDLIEDGSSTLKKPKAPSPPLAPLPPLPSPLLCPRRAFLASLILASKFTQDKCYSNRAWAKLSGLPPREIGRCERALGAALEWRLWVGKSSSQPQGTQASVSPPTGKPLARCRSEASLPLADDAGFLSCSDKKSAPTNATPVSPPTLKHSNSAGLRRAVTLPAEAFAFGAESKYTSSRDRAIAQWVHNGIPLNAEELVDSTMVSPESSPGAKLGSALTDVYASDISPTTPGLSYSPTSTESSCGDRTIQMPCFDDNMSSSFHSSCGASMEVPSEVWPWLDHSPPHGQIACAVSSLAALTGREYGHFVGDSLYGSAKRMSHGLSGPAIDVLGTTPSVWSPADVMGYPTPIVAGIQRTHM